VIGSVSANVGTAEEVTVGVAGNSVGFGVWVGSEIGVPVASGGNVMIGEAISVGGSVLIVVLLLQPLNNIP
jgi:hypothetical protein